MNANRPSRRLVVQRAGWGKSIVDCLTIQDAHRVAAWLQANHLSAREGRALWGWLFFPWRGARAVILCGA